MRVQTLRKGVFVSLVTPGSPAAMAGLRYASREARLRQFFICFSHFRFGDQILALGRKSVAGWDREKVKYILKFKGLNMRLINW